MLDHRHAGGLHRDAAHPRARDDRPDVRDTALALGACLDWLDAATTSAAGKPPIAPQGDVAMPAPGTTDSDGAAPRPQPAALWLWA